MGAIPWRPKQVTQMIIYRKIPADDRVLPVRMQ